ncbi:hypothetical protein Tco_0928542, partial [Tanacetum coccineum]
EGLPTASMTPDDIEAGSEWGFNRVACLLSRRSQTALSLKVPKRLLLMVLIWLRQTDKPLRHCILNILNRERRDSRPSLYRRSPYMDLPPTTILPKKQGDKTKNKGKNANVSPLNLGDSFADDNVGGDDVMIMGERDTGNLIVYENVEPSKVRREDYIDSTKFLLNPYDVYLDCYMMGYLVSDFFRRQLVPHLYMAGFHSLERPNEEGWFSGDHMNA